MPDVNIVMMAGVGGTGKGEILRRAEAVYGGSISVLRSTNRAAAAEAGFKTEDELNRLSGKDRTEVQRFILHYYSRAVVKAIKDAKRAKSVALLTERSPADYVAYLGFAAPPEILSKHEIDILGESSLKSILSATGGSVRIVYLPWPPSWYEMKTVDGFRKVDYGKDSVLNTNTLSAMSHLGRFARSFGGHLSAGKRAAPPVVRDDLNHWISADTEDLDQRTRFVAQLAGLDPERVNTMGSSDDSVQATEPTGT